MTHAASTPGGMRTTSPPARTGTPDVFSERVHRIAQWALPAVIGLAYGCWAATNRRSGAPVTGWNLLFGFATAVAFMVLYIAVRAVARRLKRELRALLWSVFAGASIGFLCSQASVSVLETAAVSLAVAAGLFLMLIYHYYTRKGEAENQEGPT
ncbi:hypothetical protein [Streptomyces glaucus]|uniref:Integral membrane protein n=1 Tax=Streptomyces glaucus TaxID=284029 RepID=A0ABN3K1C3_9ACTN